MSSVIGALRVVLGMDRADFTEGANASERRLGQMQKSFQRAGRDLQRSGATMSAAISAPLIAVAYKSVAAAQEQERAIAAVSAALDSMGDGAGFTLSQLQDMASELQNASLFGDEEILNKVTANLLTFGNIQGDVFEDAQRMALDLSARLGQDLQSSAVMLGKALNDPVSGLTALQRVGVMFTEDQKVMIREMAQAGDVAGAQALMMEELKRQYEGQAQALADTDSGKITQSLNAIGDATEKIGAVILPVLADLAQSVQSVAEKFSNLSPETQKFAVMAAGVAMAVGPVLMGLGAFVGTAGKLLPLVTALASPIGLVVLGLAGLAAGAVYVVQNWDELVAQVTEFADRILERLKALPGEMLQAGKDAIQGFIDGLKGSIWRVDEIAEGIADGTLESTRRGLRSKSPSRAMMEIGADAGAGFAIGLQNTMAAVTGAAGAVAAGTLAAVDQGLSGGALTSLASEAMTGLEGVEISLFGLADTSAGINEQIGGLFTTLAKDSTSMTDIVARNLARIGDELLMAGFTGAATSIGAGDWFSSLGSFAGLSFDGGGYTPPGSRVGGTDGRGGMPATIHPNEYVDDLTGPYKGPRREGMGGGGALSLSITTDPGVIVSVVENTAGAMIQQNNAAMDQAMTGRINTQLAESDGRKR